jgi:prepilin-type processing-associated H-X9-DG protein
MSTCQETFFLNYWTGILLISAASLSSCLFNQDEPSGFGEDFVNSKGYPASASITTLQLSPAQAPAVFEIKRDSTPYINPTLLQLGSVYDVSQHLFFNFRLSDSYLQSLAGNDSLEISQLLSTKNVKHRLRLYPDKNYYSHEDYAQILSGQNTFNLQLEWTLSDASQKEELPFLNNSASFDVDSLWKIQKLDWLRGTPPPSNESGSVSLQVQFDTQKSAILFIDLPELLIEQLAASTKSERILEIKLSPLTTTTGYWNNGASEGYMLRLSGVFSRDNEPVLMLDSLELRALYSGNSATVDESIQAMLPGYQSGDLILHSAVRESLIVTFDGPVLQQQILNALNITPAAQNQFDVAVLTGGLHFVSPATPIKAEFGTYFSLTAYSHLDSLNDDLDGIGIVESRWSDSTLVQSEGHANVLFFDGNTEVQLSRGLRYFLNHASEGAKPRFSMSLFDRPVLKPQSAILEYAPVSAYALSNFGSGTAISYNLDLVLIDRYGVGQ